MPRTSLRFDRTEFESNVRNLLGSLQILPKDFSLYTLACVHRSVLNEASSGYSESNERLEYLGDAVLELVITEALFREFPDKDEGELTDIRSALVRGRISPRSHRDSDSHRAYSSRGEAIAGGNENPYILANTFEAIIGALYLDHGFAAVEAFLLKHVFSTLSHILEKGLFVDPKSFLQEFTQGVWGITPTYSVLEEIGQEHNRTYRIGVTLGGIELGVGNGSSKKKGEQDAAENAVARRKEWEKEIKLARKVQG